MDAGTRQKRVEALEAIKNKALEMAVKGNDSIDVRGFVKDAKMNLAFELPDQEAFEKAKAQHWLIKDPGKDKTIF